MPKIKCKKCDGRRWIIDYSKREGSFDRAKVCPECKGKGEVEVKLKHNPSQVATVVARGNKKVFVVATDSSESNEALLDRVNAVRVIKRVNTSVNPKKRKIKGAGSLYGTSAYSKATSLGYPYVRGEGKVASDGETWLSRFSKTYEGKPGVYVGWNDSTKKWVVEYENPAATEWDFDDIADEGARLGSQAAKALGFSARKKAKEPKRYGVTWYSPLKGKRTGFMRPIEADSQAEAKRQAKAMITNDPKASNFIAKEVKRNPKMSGGASKDRAGWKVYQLQFADAEGKGGSWQHVFSSMVRKEARKVANDINKSGGRAYVEHYKPKSQRNPKKPAHLSAPIRQQARQEISFLIEQAEKHSKAGKHALAKSAINKARVIANLHKVAMPRINPDLKDRLFNPSGLHKRYWKGPQGQELKLYDIVNASGKTIAMFYGDKVGVNMAAKRYENDIDLVAAVERLTGSKVRLFKYAHKGGASKAVGRRNPTAREMSERFNGNANGKVIELKASSRAPSDLSRAGKLVCLTVPEVKRGEFKIPGAVVCIDPKTEKLWIAGNRSPLLNRKAKPGTVLDCGPIDRIVYETAKAHIGGGKVFHYDHKFGENGGRKPHLHIDSDGMPIIAGGDYKIRAEGIVN